MVKNKEKQPELDDDYPTMARLGNKWGNITSEVRDNKK